MSDSVSVDIRPDDQAGIDEAFHLLADKTRLDILKALWSIQDPVDPSPVAFTEIKEQVDVDDPGRLNYHLGKLSTYFIRRTDDGYELREAGKRIMRVVISGTVVDRPTIESVEIEAACLFCGGSTEMAYEDGQRYHYCSECDARCVGDYPPSLLGKENLPAAGLVNRSADEIYRAGDIWLKHRRESVFDGVCPECSGQMTVERIRICEDHDHKPVQTNKTEACDVCGSMFWGMVYHVCEVCRYTWKDSTAFYPTTQPAVIAFYQEHGIELDTAVHEKRRHIFDIEDNQEVVSTDPLRIRISICLDGDELHLTYDEGMRVVDVNRSS